MWKTGTTEENKKIINDYSKKDRRIRVLDNKKNIGLVKSLNRAIEYVDTKYIARMDSDDISDKDRLKIQIDFLEKNPQYALVGSRANYMNEKGIYKNSQFSGEVTKELLARFCVFFHPSIIIRTDIIKSLNGYENYLRNEDYALYFKLYYKGYKGYVMKNILLDYRQDMESFKRKNYKDRIVEAKIRKKYLKLLRINFFKRILYTVKPLLVGIIPGEVMYLYKKVKNEKK